MTAATKKLRGGVNADVIKTPPKQKPSTTPAHKTKNEIQAIVDKIVFEKGRNVIHWGDYPIILNALGLSPTDVTEKMIEEGHRKAEERHAAHKLTTNGKVYHFTDLRKCKDGDVLDWLKYVALEMGWSVSLVYHSPKVLTQAGITQEQITPEIWAQAIEECYPLAKQWMDKHNFLVAEGLATGHVSPDYRSWAADAHPETKKKENFHCLSESPPDNDSVRGFTQAQERGSTMKMKRSEAVALFNLSAMGQKTDPAKWTLKITTTNVNNLAKLKDEEREELLNNVEEENKELAAVLVAIFNSAKKGTRIEVEDDEAAEEESTTPQKGKGKMVTATAKKGNKAGDKPSKNGAVKTSPKKSEVASSNGKSNGGKGGVRDGLLGRIAEVLLGASSQKQQMSRDDAVARLAKEFPHREEKTIRKNVSDYLSWWGPRKGIEFGKSSDGKNFWVKKKPKASASK